MDVKSDTNCKERHPEPHNFAITAGLVDDDAADDARAGLGDGDGEDEESTVERRGLFGALEIEG